MSIFKGKKSFTGEESVEISCHGSIFIQDKSYNFNKSGCRLAIAGEFSMSIFKNGKLDLSKPNLSRFNRSETESYYQT